jgi:hypothetical protein
MQLESARKNIVKALSLHKVSHIDIVRDIFNKEFTTIKLIKPIYF